MSVVYIKINGVVIKLVNFRESIHVIMSFSLGQKKLSAISGCLY